MREEMEEKDEQGRVPSPTFGIAARNAAIGLRFVLALSTTKKKFFLQIVPSSSILLCSVSCPAKLSLILCVCSAASTFCLYD